MRVMVMRQEGMERGWGERERGGVRIIYILLSGMPM